MTERVGYSQYYTPPGTAEATGSGYGFQRTGAEIDTVVLPIGEEVYIAPLNALGDELGHPFQFDDFDLIGLTDINPLGGADDLPAGSYEQIDAAHAGRWKIGAEGLFHGAAEGGGFTLQFWLRVNSDFMDSIVFSTHFEPVGGDDVDHSFTVTLTILPQYVDLAEGDVVYMSASELEGSVDGYASNVTMTGTYIGPALPPPS